AEHRVFVTIAPWVVRHVGNAQNVKRLANEVEGGGLAVAPRTVQADYDAAGVAPPVNGLSDALSKRPAAKSVLTGERNRTVVGIRCSRVKLRRLVRHHFLLAHDRRDRSPSGLSPSICAGALLNDTSRRVMRAGGVCAGQWGSEAPQSRSWESAASPLHPAA